MSTSRFRTVAVLAAVMIALPLAGCASGRAKSKADTSYVARDVATLYNAAKGRLDRGDYKLAAALFDEVERQHPYSVWARRAQLMSAFSYYLARDYTESTSSAQRFLYLPTFQAGCWQTLLKHQLVLSLRSSARHSFCSSCARGIPQNDRARFL